jgi:hypothetical protein
MDRELSTETLIDYHFGTLPADRRAAVEEALLGSPEALRAYLRTKRELDRAHARTQHAHGDAPGDADEVPSPAARQRLRAEVAELVRPRPARKLWGVLARPVPLYQTLAVAALAGLVVAIAGAWWPVAGGGAPPADPGIGAAAPRVDFAPAGPQGLAVF